MQVASERGLDGGDKLLFHLDERGERAGQRGQDAGRIVEPAQDGLRAFGQAFTLGVELLQDFETGMALGNRAVARHERGFRFAQLLLLAVEFFFRRRNLRGQVQQRFVLLVGACLVRGELARDAVASTGGLA